MVLKIKQRGKRFINLMEQYFSVFQQCLQQIQLRHPLFTEFLILFYVVFVIATFSKSDVTGEKLLDSWHSRFRNGHFVRLVWNYSHIFNIRKGRLQFLYGYFIDCIYNKCDSIYMFSYVSHKKDIYNSDSNKKVMGGWSFVCFGMLGISVAKIMSSKIPYISMIRIAGLGFYVLSLLCLMSIFFS